MVLALNHRLSFKEWNTAVHGRSSNWILLANAEGHAPTHAWWARNPADNLRWYICHCHSWYIYHPNWSWLYRMIGRQIDVFGLGSCMLVAFKLGAIKNSRTFSEQKDHFQFFGGLIYSTLHDDGLQTKQPTPSPPETCFFFPMVAVVKICLCRALAESDALVVNSKKFREASMAYPAAATLGRTWDAFCWILLVDWQGSFKWIFSTDPRL